MSIDDDDDDVGDTRVSAEFCADFISSYFTESLDVTQVLLNYKSSDHF